MLASLAPRQPRGRVLSSSAGGPGFNPPTRTASYQRRYKNGTSSSLVWHSTLKKGNTGSFSRIKIKSGIEILEVVGHWPLWRG